jgi:hypothetical protein
VAIDARTNCLEIKIKHTQVTDPSTGKVRFVVRCSELVLTTPERELWQRPHGMPALEDVFGGKRAIEQLETSHGIERTFLRDEEALAYIQRVQEACRATLQYWDEVQPRRRRGFWPATPRRRSPVRVDS